MPELISPAGDRICSLQHPAEGVGVYWPPNLTGTSPCRSGPSASRDALQAPVPLVSPSVNEVGDNVP